MRIITDHIVEGDLPQNQLTVEVTDAPGAGGANHRYDISGIDSRNPSFGRWAERPGSPGRETTILFQNGPINEVGLNGVTQEVLLAIVIDRLRSFQAGPFSCKANEAALFHCEAALTHLQERTKERLPGAWKGKLRHEYQGRPATGGREGLMPGKAWRANWRKPAAQCLDMDIQGFNGFSEGAAGEPQ